MAKVPGKELRHPYLSSVTKRIAVSCIWDAAHIAELARRDVTHIVNMTYFDEPCTGERANRRDNAVVKVSTMKVKHAKQHIFMMVSHANESKDRRARRRG